jgi:hypothetical protein
MKTPLPTDPSTDDLPMPLDLALHGVTSHLNKATALLLTIRRGGYIDLPDNDEATNLMSLGQVKRDLQVLEGMVDTLDSFIRAFVSSPKTVGPAKSSNDNLSPDNPKMKTTLKSGQNFSFGHKVAVPSFFGDLPVTRKVCNCHHITQNNNQFMSPEQPYGGRSVVLPDHPHSFVTPQITPMAMAPVPQIGRGPPEKRSSRGFPRRTGWTPDCNLTQTDTSASTVPEPNVVASKSSLDPTAPAFYPGNNGSRANGDTRQDPTGSEGE